MAFFGFNLVNDVVLACLVGPWWGRPGLRSRGNRRIVNRYSEAHIQGRAKSTTSFGSRVFGLAAIGIVYLLVTTFQVSARTFSAGCVFSPSWGPGIFSGLAAEKKGQIKHQPIRGDYDIG